MRSKTSRSSSVGGARQPLRVRGEQRARERRLEVPAREPFEAVLERDRLALLGQLHAPRRMPRGLRRDRRVRRSAAAPGAAAAAVEDRQLDAVPLGDRRELLLRAVDRPLRREVAAVLARVRVADHHLHRPPASNRRRSSSSRIARRGREVVDRLEQRHDREPGRSASARRTSSADDVPEMISVSSACAPCRTPRLVRCGERLARPVGVEVARMQPHVELRDVEAEDLDHPLEPRHAAFGDPAPAVCAQGCRARAAGRRAARPRPRSPSFPSRHHMKESLRRYGSSFVARTDLARRSTAALLRRDGCDASSSGETATSERDDASSTASARTSAR